MSEDERTTIASAIRSRLVEARKAKKYTQEDMGDFFDMSKQGWRRYEEKAELKASMIVQVCAILECSPSWLLGVNDDGQHLAPESELLKELKREFAKLNAHGQGEAVKQVRYLAQVPELKNQDEGVE